ncbi:hypothetical protein [Aquimarina pacifica]|uniref:hypothetical protein n=1 Tax=Aquimarina pacifica TaxID=1296415 RepID=UPI000472DC53|nr:hypothetical protein [Aquimarina pacifica]
MKTRLIQIKGVSTQKYQFYTLIFLVTFFLPINAQISVIEDRTEFLQYAGTAIVTESFEGLAPITGANVVTQISGNDLTNRFQIDSEGAVIMQVWDTEHATDGNQAIFFSSNQVNKDNPSKIKFSNFRGISAEINAFGFYIIDWANALSEVDEGELTFTTNTGITGVLEKASLGIPDWNVRYFGIITSTPFTEITIASNTKDSWTLLDNISYGQNGLIAPQSTDDISTKVPSDFICEGTTKGFPVDIDGVDNDTVHDPNEVLFLIVDLNGKIAGHLDFGNKALFYSFLNNDCTIPPCTNCESGKFLFRFVDMTTPGFDRSKPDTWTYITIPKISLRAKNDKTARPNAINPKSIIKAYKTINNAIPENLIDVNPTIDITGSGIFTYTDCSFEDLDDGIAEIYVQTDFAENIMDDIILYSDPANTPLGTSVAVTEGDATLTFDRVESVGITKVSEQETGPALSGNFSLCDPSIFYNITTTSDYEGTITICMQYDESCEGPDLNLLHYEDGVWVNVTTSIDTTTNTICGNVTSLSPFVIAKSVRKNSDFKLYVVLLAVLLILIAVFFTIKKRK